LPVAKPENVSVQTTGNVKSEPQREKVKRAIHAIVSQTFEELLFTTYHEQHTLEIKEPCP
jgi:hypothetical protein